MYPESVAADVLAGVVHFSFAANRRLGHFTVTRPGASSHTALHTDDTDRQLMVESGIRDPS